MKKILRHAALLGLIGTCFWLGRWQGQHAASEASKASFNQTVSRNPAKAAATAAYFTSLEEIRALFADETRNWHDKWRYFVKGLMPGINPADLPEVIQFIGALSIKPNENKSRETALNYLIGDFAMADPESALALLGDYPHLHYREDYYSSTLWLLAAHDPQKALDMLAKLPSDAINPRLAIHTIFRSWARNHPTEAAAAALSVTPPSNQRAALAAVGESLTASDPAAAIQWAQSLPPEYGDMLESVVEAAVRNQLFNGKFDVTHQVFNGKFDGSTVAAELNLIPDLSKRNSLIYETLPQIPPAQAMDWLNQYASGVVYDQVVNEIFERDNDWNSLVVALDKITDPGVRASAIMAMPKARQQDDPKAALAWAVTLPDADAVARDSAINAILSNLAHTDLAAAEAFIQNSANPTAYLPAAFYFAQVIAVTDQQAALNWTLSLPDGGDKYGTIGSLLAKSPPAELPAAWDYAASLPEGPNRDEAMFSFVTILGVLDPTQAVAFALEMPDGPSKPLAISLTFQSFLVQDPSQATTWLTGLAPGEARDLAITTLVGTTQTEKQPAEVLAWANTVGDPEKREGLIQNVLITWMKIDPAAAFTAAQTVNLPEAARADLVQMLKEAQAELKK